MRLRMYSASRLRRGAPERGKAGRLPTRAPDRYEVEGFVAGEEEPRAGFHCVRIRHRASSQPFHRAHFDVRHVALPRFIGCHDTASGGSALLAVRNVRKSFGENADRYLRSTASTSRFPKASSSVCWVPPAAQIHAAQHPRGLRPRERRQRRLRRRAGARRGRIADVLPGRGRGAAAVALGGGERASALRVRKVSKTEWPTIIDKVLTMVGLKEHSRSSPQPRAACASACRSRARWRSSRRCCSWTSRSARSTRSRAGACTASCSTSGSAPARRSCSSRMTSPRR